LTSEPHQVCQQRKQQLITSGRERKRGTSWSENVWEETEWEVEFSHRSIEIGYAIVIKKAVQGRQIFILFG
jgi:hypothetical protein